MSIIPILIVLIYIYTIGYETVDYDKTEENKNSKLVTWVINIQ